jgi:protein TonB
VDLAPEVVRNSGVHAKAQPRPTDDGLNDTGALGAPALMVDVVVLTGDLDLFEATRHAVGERNPVWRARSAEESVDLLLTGRCGVLLIDMAAVTAKPATLVEQIVDQFPDVVVVVAGRREDESVLAGLISDGLVYRFMHKPLSPKRAGMFLNAAIRSHVERREGRATEPLLPLVRELKSRVDPRKWLFVGGGLIVFLAVLAAVLIARYGQPQAPDPAVASRAGTPSAPLADPVLSRARAALAAGRYDSPPGRNALDLYSAVLLTRPDDVEAQRGLQTTLARLVANAERAAAAGDAAEARRIAQRVLQADSNNAAARTVLARLELPRPAPAAVVEPAIPSESPAAGATQATRRDAGPPPAGPADRRAQVPVTRLMPVPAAAPPPAPTPAPAIRVQPDPLTPRIVGPGSLPTSQVRRSPSTPTRYYAGPAAPALPIAGYEKRAPEPAAAAPIAVEPGVLQRDLEPVATPEPAYPPAAFRQGVGGWVEVEYTVNERGTTMDVAVVAAEPRGVFDEAAVAAVAGWKYRPRVVNGRPVAQRTSVTLRFSVED